MSKVKIQGNASGTGIFTVAAPATNTDRTITLPDTSATIMTTDGGNFTQNVGIALDGYPALKFRNAAGADKAEIYVGTGAGDLNVVVNSQAAISVDSAARIRTPYQPAFLVTRNAGDSGSLSANTVLPFNYTIFNRGNHFNTSTYTFTAPVAGVYMFYTHLYHQVPANTSTRIMIKKNGSEIFQGTDVIPHAYVSNYEGTTRDMTSQTSYIIDMNVGDYVNVAVRNGQTGRFYGGHSLFYGYLLG